MLKRLIFVHIALLAFAATAFSQAQNPVAGNNQVQSDFNFGMELYKNKMYDLAEEQFTKFLQEYPTASSAGQARFYLAKSQLQLREFAKAAQSFQAFAVQYPTDPSAPDGWMNAGESFAKAKDYSNAALSFERLQVFFPKDVRAAVALIDAAKYFEMAGDTARAENSLVTVAEDYSSSASYPAATLELGNLYLSRRELDKAESQFKILVSSGNDSVRVMGMVALGRLEKNRGRTRQAEQFFDDAAQLNIIPQSLDALLESIEMDLNAGNFSMATQRAGQIDITALTKEQKEELEFINAYAEIGEGNVDSVRSEMGGLATLPPHYRIKLAEILNTKSDYSDGLSMLSNFPESETNGKVLDVYADLAFNAGKIRLADSVLTRYLDFSTSPSSRIVVELLTVEDKYFHDPARMRETFYKYESALKQRPDAYLYYKARTDQASGDYAAAADEFREVVRDYPESDYSSAADSISNYLQDFKNIDYRNAIVDIANVLLEQSVGKEGALLQLGQLYGNTLKDYSKAADVYRRLVTEATGDTERVAEYLLANALDKVNDGPPGENSNSYSIYQKLASDTSEDSIAAGSLLRLVQMQAASGDSLAAENTALNFLKRFPDSRRAPEVYLTLAGVLYNTGAYHQAIAQAQMSGSSPEAVLLSARAEIAIDSTDAARATLLNLISSIPPKKYLLEAQNLYISLLKKSNQDAGPEYLSMLTGLVPSAYKDSVEVNFGNYLYSEGLYDSAYTVYGAVGSEALWDKIPTYAIYRMAYCKLKAGDLQRAKGLFGEVIASSNDPAVVADSYVQLGNIYDTLGDKEMSASFLEKAGTNNVDALVTAAATYFKVEDYQDAAQVYRKILKSATSDTLQALAAARLIQIDYRTNDIAGADAAAAKFRVDYPDAPKEYPALFLVEKAKYLIQNKNYDEAQRLLDIVKSRYKDTSSYTTALLEEARISVELGAIEKAQSKLVDLLKKYPNSADAPEAHLELGNIYYAQQKYQEAINNLRPVYADSATADRKILRDAMSRLISAYESAGQYAGALDVDRRFIAMFPDDPSIMDKKIKVGILYEELRYFEQALLTFKGLVNQVGAQHQAELHYYIGAIYDDMGNYTDAILEFLKVPYLTTSNPVIDWAAQAYYMAGQCYEKLNKPNEAIAMYEKIVHKPNTDPNFVAGAEREIKRVKALLK